jgi:3'-phosphoadenosine 5'-phosphosulfate sulfotransferase (PAPS reductase)/FAD synthetase
MGLQEVFGGGSMKHIASVSFGKDSLAMLLLLIERQYPLDEVVFYDTGKEFQAIYRLRDKIETLLSNKGIKYVELTAEPSFDYLMFEKPVCKRGTKTVHKYGYSWCGGTCRWGTTAKLKALEQYAAGHIEYVGIAIDEPERLKKERKGNKLFPLAEWGMTEQECLDYCYSKGYDWIEEGVELYSILDRVSCWCCRNKNLKELYHIYLYLPCYWQKLKDLQARLPEPMKQFKNKKYGEYGNLFDLEKVFEEKSLYQHGVKGEPSLKEGLK